MKMSDVINEIENWFSSQCDGNWEHQGGVRIESLDNPGWLVEIKLPHAKEALRNFAQRNEDRSERDWIQCSVSGDTFKGAGGPSNLAEILATFLNWIRS